MPEKFNLRYNGYQTNLANNFKKLINEEEFLDVTLVSDDQKQFSAHKLVLSSSSTYFKNILKQTKHSHPMLCLDGIGSNELNDVLHYIYNGEVEIYQDHIDRFLGIAFRLQLEGLINNNASDETDSLEVGYQNLSNKLCDAIVPRKENPPKPPSDTYIKAEKQESVIKAVKTEKNDTRSEKVVNSSDMTLNSSEIELKIDESYEKSRDDDLYHCKFCNYASKRRTHTREHVETHYDFKYNCNNCDKILNSKVSLRHHNSIHKKQDQEGNKDMEMNSPEEKEDQNEENNQLIKQEKKLNNLLKVIERKADAPKKVEGSATVIEDHTNEDLCLSEIEEKMANHMEMISGGYKCTVCQYSSKHKDHVREHLDKHVKFTYNCNLCEKSFGSKHAFRRDVALHRKASLEVHGSI